MVIVMPNHFPFIQRNINCPVRHRKIVTFQNCSRFNQLFVCPEIIRIIGHIEITGEPDIPSILISKFIPKDNGITIYLGRQCSITRSPENRTSFGIGIKQTKITRPKRINSLRVKQMVKTSQIKTSFHRTRLRLLLAGSKKTEFEHSMYVK